MQAGNTKARHVVASLFAAIHVVAFLLVLARIPALPSSAYVDPPPSTILLPGGGMQFNMCHDCGPHLVLAGRGFGWGMPGNNNFTQALLLANLPSQIGAGILGAIVAEPLGQYGKMWLVTCSFGVMSVAQWWALGWILARRLNRKAVHPAHLQGEHS